MATALATLIKLCKSRVEDKQKEIAVFRDKIIALETKIAELHAAIVREEEAAKGSPDLSAYFGTYQQRAHDQIEQSKELIRQTEEALQPHLDELAELFAEQKRVEILHARKLEEARKQRLKKEQQQLDEIATVRHARKSGQKG